MTTQTAAVGDLLREWRTRRHLSQLELATEAEISARHLSFIETGRSIPSREMLLHLAERLDVPFRSRNLWLTAAGYAAVFPERPLADPAMSSARQAIDHLLAAHEPYPAVAIDRHWKLLSANQAAVRLLAGVMPALAAPSANVLRLSLHPDGLASRIVNLAEWRHHLLERLRRQIDATADPVLRELAQELAGYPAPPGRPAPIPGDEPWVFVPLQLRTEVGVLSFLSTTTIFGTPVDVTLSEIALETFFPANAHTADQLRRLA